MVDGIQRPLRIYCDNKFVVQYSNNNRSTTKSKFIDIKFLIVKEKVQNRQISIKHTETDSMLPDPHTKGLVSYVFHIFVLFEFSAKIKLMFFIIF